MGQFLEKPITEKNVESGAGLGLKWACSHMQGWRVSMEDAHSCRIGLGSGKAGECSFFGCFDGHGGSIIANHSAQYLIDTITKTEEWGLAISKMETDDNIEAVRLFQEAMRKGSMQLDKTMRELPSVRSNEDHSGTTAVYSLVTPTHIIVGNIGDSRSILVRGGSAVAMSYDHKPTNPPEQARIVAANGTVTLSRVNGDLAVSRALGDYTYKTMTHLPAEAQQVSPEPEFQIQERTSDDQVLILCCDGIWDVMSNEEVGAFYMKELQSNDLATTCSNILDECLSKKSRDNMTAIAIALR